MKLTRQQQFRNLLEDQVDLFLDAHPPQGPALKSLSNADEAVLYEMFIEFLKTSRDAAKSRAQCDLMGRE